MKTISRRLIISTFLFLFLAGFSLHLQAQNLKEYIKADSMKVGDTFFYRLTLAKSELYDEVIFPDSSHFGDPFEIRTRQQYKITDFKDSLVYQLQFFGTEDTRIPPLPVRLISNDDTSTVYTNPVPIYFSSVLESENEELKPLKPIFDFARAWWPYLLALILLALLAWYLYNYFKEQPDAPPSKPRPTFKPEPFINPLEQLENTLRQLKSFTFETKEDYKQFYINLGDAIRRYFEDLYRIPALESTSREIIHELERRMVDQRLIDQTREVLQEADMVKFARFQPTEEQTQKALSTANRFLNTAREIDKERIEHLRKKHRAQMQEEQLKFETEVVKPEEV